MNGFKYVITVEGTTPPNIILGSNIGGAIVTELKAVTSDLITASQAAAKYNLSVQTVRRKLAAFNQGSTGKCLYSIKIVDEVLNPTHTKSKGGARRKN